ncbi:DUF2157 domain-containing protein [Pleionea sp. CnH1-48]|uniref:DUF2157 domain-containing protein n=1 Tax=Pleionea sp. CnH1-48 TaxID=2954494 RepID=UPI002096E7FE|nr:DUF2157 domain-containing protein [Pleionea sp. CnH1-48]MCO7226459.1 DUF2157 domain-containing protein [Pleionea sp. CnH1-48]
MRLIRLLKNDIAREAAEWVDESIITEAQAERICQRYDADYHQAKNKSFGYNLLVGLAYLFIGLAVITILGANWDDIPRAVRMGGLVALTLATQAFGVKKYLQGEQTGAAGVFMLGNLFYGASIILIAQIYHLGEHMPDGIFWWALGCLPFGVLIKSPWVTLQSLVLACIWFFVESDMGFYPALFPIFIAGALYVLTTGKRSILLLLTTAASIGLWFEYSLSELWRDSRYFRFEAEHVVVSVGLFILLYAFSHWLGKKESVKAKDYGAILAVWSLRFGAVFMLVMSYEQTWKELIRADWEHQTTMVLISLIFSGAALYLSYAAKKLMPIVIIVPFYWITLLMLLASVDKSAAVYFQVVYNLTLIASSVWLIFKGLHEGISHYFFLGVATILMTALMRYFDLIGDYVGGAVLFSVFAVLLFVAAKFWKKFQTKELAR